MSTNFSGVTFAQQRVTPIDDAIIRRAILPDGILTGCRLSYSGSTLTMAAGQMVICGRQIRHAASQNWAVVGATSGYARLLLTIDLTRTATKEIFDQVVDTIEYASSLDGFLALEQADINAAGTKYQIPICVVSLGAGGITGIVSQLEPASAGILGGLNFNLVGGLTQPADLKENTIWVNTGDKITGWALSFGAPAEPYEGMVWIMTGTGSKVAFNALKKNTLMVYPTACKQFVNGAWNNVTAKSYIGGEWVDWRAYLFIENGGQQVPWVFKALNTKVSNVSEKNGAIVFEYSAVDNSYLATGTEDPEDLSGFTKLCFDLEVRTNYTSGGGEFTIGVTSKQVNAEYNNTFIASEKPAADSVRKTIKVDVSGITSGYVSAYGIVNATIYNVWRE